MSNVDDIEKRLRKFIKNSCRKAWMARTLRKMTSPPHGYRLKYKNFDQWWRQCGLTKEEKK